MKRPSLDISFINIVKNLFLNGEDLDLAHVIEHTIEQRKYTEVVP